MTHNNELAQFQSPCPLCGATDHEIYIYKTLPLYACPKCADNEMLFFDFDNEKNDRKVMSLDHFRWCVENLKEGVRFGSKQCLGCGMLIDQDGGCGCATISEFKQQQNWEAKADAVMWGE